MNGFTRLPGDVHRYILRYFSLDELDRLRLVDKRFRDVIEKFPLWGELGRRCLPPAWLEAKPLTRRMLFTWYKLQLKALGAGRLETISEGYVYSVPARQVRQSEGATHARILGPERIAHLQMGFAHMVLFVATNPEIRLAVNGVEPAALHK